MLGKRGYHCAKCRRMVQEWTSYNYRYYCKPCRLLLGAIDNPCVICHFRSGMKFWGNVCCSCHHKKIKNNELLPENEPLPDFYGRARLPATATDALPGSEEKLRVLEQRAAQGVSLFHPDDAVLPLV